MQANTPLGGVLLIEDYQGEQAPQQSPSPGAAITEWFINKITQARSGSLKHSGSVERSLPKAISAWVESTPFAAVLVGPSQAGKEFLLNTLIQTTFCDASAYGHLPEDPTSRWEGVKIDETILPDAAFPTQLNLAREQRALKLVSDYALDMSGAPPLDAECSFLLPECGAHEALPVLELRHGGVLELVVAFPSESELRLTLWDLHQAAPDSPSYAPLAHLYQLVLSAHDGAAAQRPVPPSAIAVPPRGCRSPQDIPLPEAVRRVLGRTVSFRGAGRDLHVDRLFVRHKLAHLVRSHFAFFAKALVVRVPSSLLEGGVTLHVVPSDAPDALSRAKAAVAVKQSNLALVAADERGMAPDVQALLAASGWLERLIARPEAHRALFLQLSAQPGLPASWAAPALPALHAQLHAALGARAPAAMADKVDRAAARAAALTVHPRLYASLQLNQVLPLQVLGHTLSEAKSRTGVPALLASFFNMRLACCAAPMRELHVQISGAGSASKLAQVSAALEEKIRTWRTDVASTARSLDDNLHSAAAASAARIAELPPAEAATGAWLSCAHLLNGAPGLWRSAVLASAPARMQEVIAAHNTVLVEAARAAEKEADPGEKRRLQRLVCVAKQVNERRVKARMAALRDELAALDPDAVAQEAVRGALHLPGAPPNTAHNSTNSLLAPAAPAASSGSTPALPTVPVEAARRLGARLGHVLDRYDAHLVSLEQETAHSLRVLQQALPGGPGSAHASMDDTQPLTAQLQDMALDAGLQPTAQEHKTSRTNSAATPPLPSEAAAGADAPLFLSDELWQRLHDALDADAAAAARAAPALQRGKPVRADGSAQFRALAELLYGSEEAHPVVRLLVLGELLAQPAVYAGAVETGRRPAPYDEYVAHMARDAAWGDRISLAAAAAVLGHHILVYSPASPRPLLVPSPRAAPYTTPAETLPVLLLAPNTYEALVYPARRLTLDRVALPQPKPAGVPASASASLDTADESSSSSVSGVPSDSDSSADVGPAKRRLSAARPPAAGRAPPTRTVYALVDLCVAAVAAHAEQLPSLEGAVPEELLQRLVSHLIAEGRLHNQVLMRLLDGSLFALSLDHCHDLNDTSLAIVARACTSLRRLSLENCVGVTSEGLAHVAERCALLEVLNVEGCTAVADAALRALAPRCPNLLVLNLSATRVSDAGLAALAACRNLHSLSLRKCALVTAQGLQQLPTELVQLDATDCQALTDEAALYAVAARCAATLQQLKVSGKNVRDAAVLHLARTCSALRLLELPGANLVTEAAVAALARFCPLLTSLALPACRRLTLESGLEAQPMANLQHLDLSRCLGITDAALARALRAGLLPLLATLNLASCEEVADAALAALAAHSPHLRSLTLAKCRRVTDAGLLAVIRACPHLQRLVLTNCHVTDASVAHLATACRELVELDLACCERVTDVSVRSIVQGCTALELLSLEELPQLTELGIAAVGEHSAALHTFRVGHCKVLTDAGLARLSAGCPRMRSVDLSYCNALTVAGVQRALDAWPSLRVLILRGFAALASTGLEHARLEVLNASWSKNLDDGALLHTAHACPRLTSLDIAWCTRVSDVAIHRLAQKPTHASALRVLNLRGCSKISDLLLKLLSNNRRLQVFR